jgi:hypothetical protein
MIRSNGYKTKLADFATFFEAHKKGGTVCGVHFSSVLTLFRAAVPDDHKDGCHSDEDGQQRPGRFCETRSR